MYPSDEWLLLLNFYLIVNSGGDLTILDFNDERLAEAFQENPGEQFEDMDATARKLVLEFQAQKQDTNAKNSPMKWPVEATGEIEECSNGPVSISMLGVPADF